MGDLILSTSLIRQIKNKFPDSNLFFAVSKEFSEALEFNPWIDNLIKYDKNAELSDIISLKKHLKDSLPESRFDYVVDLQRNLRSKVLRSGLAKKYLLIHKRRLHKLSLVYFKKPLLKSIVPVSDINRFTIAHLGVEDDGLGNEVWLPTEAQAGVYPPSKRINDYNNNLIIGLAPGAFHFTKRYPVQKYIELIKQLRLSLKAKIMLIGGKADEFITSEIINKTGGEFLDATQSVSIIETAKNLDQCSLLITNDTGVMHLAAARNVPVIAIFGSTVKELGFIPYRVDHRIVEKDIPCRPCTHIGRDTCPKKHFDCMNKIEINDILKAVKDLIGR